MPLAICISSLENTCTPVFTAALFTTAKTWKQPKCPSVEEWIKKMQYIYTMDCYSVIKKNETTSPAATWMDLEIVILSEISQTEEGKCHMILLIQGIILMLQIYLQNRNRLTNLENKFMVTRGKSGGEG